MTYLQVFFPGLLAVCAATMLWHARTRSDRSRRFVGLSFLAAVLFCWPPLAWLVTRSLEWPYLPATRVDGEASAIVVLGGGLNEAGDASPIELPARDTHLRCRHAAWLHRQFPDLPILVCGGGGRAEAMRELLAREGVHRCRISLEAESSSTHENALYGARIMRQQGIGRVYLVTEAHHMLRAELSFKRQGLEVVPAPCGFRSDGFAIGIESLLPGATAIRQNEEVLHEWVGIVWYWMQRRI